MPSATPVRIDVEGIQPILRVEDMRASLRFYVDVLGFTNASWGNDDFTRVKHGGGAIYLCRGDQGRGVPVRSGPTDHPWALEMHVEDLDGNVLRFGSEPKS